MEYIIYGAGNNAEKMIEKLQVFITIKYIIDADMTKEGNTIKDIPIYSTRILESNNFMREKIIVSVTNENAQIQIYNYLESLGLKKGIDFFNGAEMVNIFEAQYGHVSGYISITENMVPIKSFDPRSRLIRLKNEKRIFRVVVEEYKQYYIDILNQLENNKILGREVIYSKVIDNNLDFNFPLVIEHEYIEPISYCFEWSPRMFEDYVIFMIEFLKKLNKINFGLEDGHLLNATLYRGEFIFIDFGAICSTITTPLTLVEFINTHILPFVLLKKNKIDNAYLLMKNSHIEFSILDVKGYLTESELQQLIGIYQKALFAFSSEKIELLLEKLSFFISQIQATTFSTRWIGYQNDEWDWSQNRDNWSMKMKNVISLIKTVKPNSIIDLAGNMGWYGSYLHDEVSQVIIADMDYGCIDHLWKNIHDRKMNNVYPVYMSLCTPSLDYYRDYPISSNSGLIPWRLSSNDRFKSELVLALAIIHHLAFGQQLTFKEIIEQISLYTKKYLIIEFVDQKDVYIDYFLKKGFEWYTRENFEKQLLRKYDILSFKESTPSETRTLYLCQLKDA